MFKVGDKVYLTEDTKTIGGIKFKITDRLTITRIDNGNIHAFCHCKREDGEEIITMSEDLRLEEPFEACMNSPQESVEDVVNHPSHYESGKFECIEVMEEALGYDAVKDFCICNAFKYLYRHKRKNGYEDIKKAQWYINKYIDMTEKAAENGTSPM